MPFSSPTTTSAVNEKRRPPLTTLATRLISTTRSWRSEEAPCLSLCLLSLAIRSRSGVANGLELQPGRAGPFGRGPDPAVVAVAAPIEDARLGARLLAPCGEQLPRLRRLLHAGEAPELLLGPGHRGEGAAGRVVDELCSHPAVRAEHRQPRPLGRAVDLGADPAAAAQ